MPKMSMISGHSSMERVMASTACPCDDHTYCPAPSKRRRLDDAAAVTGAAVLLLREGFAAEDAGCWLAESGSAALDRAAAKQSSTQTPKNFFSHRKFKTESQLAALEKQFISAATHPLQHLVTGMRGEAGRAGTQRQEDSGRR